MGLHHGDRLHRFGQGANLVQLDQQRVAGFFFNRARDAFGVGHQQVVAHNLQTVPHLGGKVLPAVPIVLGKAVFEGDDGIFHRPISPEVNHLVAGELAAFFAQVIEPGLFLVELRGSRVQRDANFFAGFIASFGDGFQNQFHSFFVGFQLGRESAFVAHQGDITFGFEHTLKRLVNLGAPAQAFREGFSAERHSHELLEVGGLPASVRAAIQDVHHRDGKHVRVNPTQIAVKRQPQRAGRGFGNRQAGAQDGIRAQSGFVRRAVQLQQQLVDSHLFNRVPAN